ncbi:MAG TPA: metallopeptidase TldD-related protein [Candidatus Acidoferrales bacterium]|nr:metallopeptidase TldD-related protein [Candidatus Acidoferrales bacterium]
MIIWPLTVCAVTVPGLDTGYESGAHALIVRQLSKAGGPTSNTPMNRIRLSIPLLIIAIFAASAILAWSAPPADKGDGILLSAMQSELARAKTSLAKSDPAPYFISYEVYDQHTLTVAGTYGTIVTSAMGNHRWADVTMRVGTPAIDNTHNENRDSGISSGALPLADDRDAISRTLWELTDREYRRATPAYAKVMTNKSVDAVEEDKSPDFSEETAQESVERPPTAIAFNQKEWEEKIRKYSALFRKFPEIYSSTVTLQVEQSTSYFVSSEGSKVETPGLMARLVVEANTRADDGMDLVRVETFESTKPDGLPSETEVSTKEEKMASDLKALREAPLAEPFDGPALLSGRAAAVFFHEVLGHRLEGHRQRGDTEGQTFTKKVNQPVLPTFLSVYDDPTLGTINDIPLSGTYSHDDEGVPSQRVPLIRDGILKNFLMSRMPITNFSKSNGHGRHQAGFMPTGRQGNLIVQSTKTVKDSEMRAQLIDEVKKQGKPYGLYFEDVQGGFTLTTRELPQAFQVLPVIVWRVYPDGRPDQLVRGVDIVGTPLASLNRILLTGDKTEVFNGICGAESGSVPVSASAPAMLFSEMEVQKRSASRERPPILPAPGFDESSASSTPASAAGGPR